MKMRLRLELVTVWGLCCYRSSFLSCFHCSLSCTREAASPLQAPMGQSNQMLPLGSCHLALVKKWPEETLPVFCGHPDMDAADGSSLAKAEVPGQILCVVSVCCFPRVGCSIPAGHSRTSSYIPRKGEKKKTISGLAI